MENVELDEVQWRSPEWVQAFGLRTDNVLDYFSLSPFYDRSSNNQVLKMQSNFNEQLKSRGADLSKELQNMKGIEYVVVISREPDLWVIRKHDRKSPSEVEVLAVYFVCGENVYQSPSVYNVLASRILATSLNIVEALRIAERLPEFKTSGYEYKRGQLPTNSSSANALPNPTSTNPVSTEKNDNANPVSQKQSAKSEESSAMLERSLDIAIGLTLANKRA